MGKNITAAGAAALLAASASIAFAAPVAPSPRAHALPTTAAAFTLKTGQLEASRIIGSTVYDLHNRNIGSVKDVLLDHGGKVDSVVLDVGSFLGIGGKYVAVALNDIKMDNDRLTLDRSKEDLQAAAAFPYEEAGNTNRAPAATGPITPPADTTNRSTR